MLKITLKNITFTLNLLIWVIHICFCMKDSATKYNRGEIQPLD